MTTCDICCEKYTTTVRKELTCPYCDYKVCISCVKQYLLTLSTDPACMKCKRGWSYDFMTESLPMAWLDKTYKTHREQVLYERELSLMPATQPLVERYILHNKLKREYKELCAQRMALNLRIRALASDIHESNPASMNMEIVKTTFVRSCPMNDCKGFLNERWKCGLCDTKVCAKCHVARTNGGHECKEEDLATAKLLMKDSKPCPSCASMIFKIDGCDQMFCTKCHTAFSWHNGTIERKNIHNPHYYEWIRKNNGVPAVEECNNVAQLIDVRTLNKVGKEALDIHRLLTHIYFVELRHYDRNDNNTNIKLRISFMMNTISENQLRQKLRQNERTRYRNKNIYDVLEMFFNTGNDILKKANNDITKDPAKKTEVQKELHDNIEELAKYANENLYHIHKRFKCLVPKIDTTRYNLTYFGKQTSHDII